MENPTSLPVKLKPTNLRPIAYRILSKKHGLNLKTDALAILTETIGYRYGSEWKGQQSQLFMEEIVRIWKAEDRGTFIDGPGLSQVIKELSSKRDNVTHLDAVTRSDTLVDDIVEEPDNVINWTDYFKFINPDKQPDFVFDKTRKQFNVITRKRFPNNMTSAVAFYRNRYNLMLERCSRNENFQKSTYTSISAMSSMMAKDNSTSEITLIKNMLGRDGSKFIIFGLLSKSCNDEFILEDLSDYIELDISQAFKTNGSYYCVGMFLIVEGIYSASGGSAASSDYLGGCFHVSNVAHPPAERRELSMEHYGNIDFLGISRDGKNPTSFTSGHINKISKPLKKQLSSMEKTLSDHKLLILGSDCFLDDNKVLDGLNKLFQKLESQAEDKVELPLAIIFIGSFTSVPLATTDSSLSDVSNSEHYKDCFDSLAKIIAKFPTILNVCKFVFIPGKNDPWQSTYSLGSSNVNILPQKNIPKFFMTRIERVLPKGNLILGWNPMRLNYLSQEIVFFKEELVTRFRRNDLVFSSDTELEKSKIEADISQIDSINTDDVHLPTKIKEARKLVKTLLDQGTLLPFLKDFKLVVPSYDNALRLEPLPTVMILNDSCFENFEVTYNGCKVINVTGFLGSQKKLNYVSYYPSSKKFDFSELIY